MNPDRLQELRKIQGEEFFEGGAAFLKLVLPQWKRKNLLIGDILFVKRRLWKKAGGFSENKKKKGHPGVVTIDSQKGSATVMLVPGTSQKPLGTAYFFCPRDKITFTDSAFKSKSTSFVLDYWRTVSRNGPFKIGHLSESDKNLLESKMIEVHQNDFIQTAYGEG